MLKTAKFSKIKLINRSFASLKMTNIYLSIIIVSWNTCDLTLKCIKSIFEYLKNVEFELFIVDNNSTDNTIKELEKLKNFVKDRESNNLKIIKNKENLGFAKANNIGIKQAKGDFILLLNPDTEILSSRSLMSEANQGDGTLLNNELFFRWDSIASLGMTAMIDFAESDEKIGIVGPKLLNSDYTLQRSCRRFPKLLDQIFIQLKFYNFFPNKIKTIKKYFMLDFDHNEIREVDQIMGAVMLIKKEVIKKIGFLDENFWAIFEEVDFCKRTKNAGYKIYFYPDCQIIHHKEQSFKQMASMRKQINFNRSLYYYFRKHKSYYQFLILWLLQPINLFLTWVNEVIGIRKKIGKGKDL